MRPSTIPSTRLPGPEYRIVVAGVPIYFAPEPPGIHVCVEGEPAEDVTNQVLAEVLANLQRATGQTGDIVDLG